MRVLIIEDDRKAAELLAKGLREEQFTVDIAHTGRLGDALARTLSHDLIILDWILPDRSGVTVCRELRAGGVTTPILILSARDAVEDRVTGLNAGADDYLTKPFSFDELLARISALLRRSRATRPTVLRAGDVTLDPYSHRVTRGEQLIQLTRKEYAILEVLMRYGDKVVSRTQLVERVWEDDKDSLFTILEVHVSRLRKKLNGTGRDSLIRTVRGVGYMIQG
ncbi:MAG TPA: response regulator transcription factor [Candidatus Bathyarchaeia archaeon]|nr:response regulator transcription factor [Candidatus Bathyarchaeia archaeon]